MINSQLLSRHIDHLQRCLVRLEGTNQRFIWARIIVFFGGLAASALAWFYLPPWPARLVILVAFAAFLLVVYQHRRLDQRVRRLSLWKERRQDQLARLELDWQAIQASSGAPFIERQPLDIDLDLTGPRSLHHLLDLAVSDEGSQRLAGWLVERQPDPEAISARQEIVVELKGLPRFIDRLLLNLRLVSKEQLKGENLLKWLKVPVSQGRLRTLLLVDTLLTVLNITLLVLYIWQGIPAWWIFTFIGTWVFVTTTSTMIKEYFDAVVELDGELDKFSALLLFLERYPLHKQPHLLEFCAPFRQPDCLPSSYLRRVKRVTAGIGVSSNPLIGLLLNVILPWNFTFAYLAGSLRGQAGDILERWLDTWSQLEALISLANFAYLNPRFCFAQVSENALPVFQAQALGHPLIPAGQRVCNNFRLEGLGEIALITGSNMAGKSTFLKTVGINVCLAYAGGPVCAEQMSLRPFRMHTCMRISDSIADGFSYFYAEVRCLRSLLDKLRQPVDQEGAAPLLYLIDEIFRGTNNRERLIGSQAYIRALIGANGIGWIATHDLELAHLAEKDRRAGNYHFRDEVRDGRLVFDFQIRPGPSPTTNALKIMQMEGLPVDEEDTHEIAAR